MLADDLRADLVGQNHHLYDQEENCNRKKDPHGQESQDIDIDQHGLRLPLPFRRNNLDSAEQLLPNASYGYLLALLYSDALHPSSSLHHNSNR
jgi:hypothetical protein